MSSLFPAAAPVAYARVAVERWIDRYPEGLTYGVGEDLADLAPGERVLVPLGRGDRPAPGYVIELTAEPGVEADAIKLVASRDPASAQLPLGLMELARWISRYYCTPIGMTLTTMLPAAVKRNVGAVTRTFVELVDPPPAEAEPAKKLTSKQRGVLEALAAIPPAEHPVELRALADRAGLGTVGPVRRLIDRGLLRTVHRTRIEAAWTAHTPDAREPDELTADQAAALEGIGVTLGRGFSAHLLFGVTGSGKTEVYIRLIRRVVDAGGTALVLVPEIALTPQTGARLLGRFPDQRVAILHSGLTASQRHQQWALAASGDARIVLGARSAVFAPIPDGALGLVIVDEEHDGSYKQDQAPRYHGRDVAIRRAQLVGCPVVLGSATPALESWWNATERRTYQLHRLPHRVPGMKLPEVRVVDLAEERRRRHDRRFHLLGPTLESALGRTLEQGGQALLLLNRRGYANYITCADQRCGWVMTCDDCDVTVVYHRSGDVPAGGYVQCHHCHREQRLPRRCPTCEARIVTFGLGTQRVEEELARTFPALTSGTTMVRVDSDAIRGARDFHTVLDRFGRGDIRVLLGTQMIAKGLDFPGVRLVGVVNADTALHMPDFRATERTFQLVNQVAGRCGRARGPAGMGTVVVQSFSPDMPAIVLAAAHDYETFARREIEERDVCGLPPTTRMARIVVRDEDPDAARQHAAELAEGLRRLAAEGVRIMGPAPCPIARIAGRHRHQVELLADDTRPLQRLLATARNHRLIGRGARMAVDVDPMVMV